MPHGPPQTTVPGSIRNPNSATNASRIDSRASTTDAESDDGVIMAVRHKELPVEAVQFHPESILTAEENCGFRLMENVVRLYRGSFAAAGTRRS